MRGTEPIVVYDHRLLEAGSFIMVPAGVLLTTFVLGEEPAEGLRWSFTSMDRTQEHQQAKAAIGLVLREYTLSSEDPIHKLAAVLEAD